MTEMQATLGRAALKDINKTNRKRRYNAKILFKELSKLDSYIKLPQISKNTNPAFSRVVFRINEDRLIVKRDIFLEAVNKEGIPLKKFYARPQYTYKLFTEQIGFGSTKFPFDFNRKIDYKKVKCPITEKFCLEQVAMEFCPYLKENDIKDIIKSIQKVVSHYKKK